MYTSGFFSSYEVFLFDPTQYLMPTEAEIKEFVSSLEPMQLAQLLAQTVASPVDAPLESDQLLGDNSSATALVGDDRPSCGSDSQEAAPSGKGVADGHGPDAPALLEDASRSAVVVQLTLEPPKLSGSSDEQLCKFQSDYTKYLDDWKARSGGQASTTPAPILQCIEPHVRWSLSMSMEGVNGPDDITNQNVWSYIMQRMEARDGMTVLFRKLASSVSMDVSLSSCRESATALKDEALKSLIQAGGFQALNLSEAGLGPDQLNRRRDWHTAVIQVLTKGLKPKAFQTSMEAAVAEDRKALSKNLTKWFAKLLEVARQFDSMQLWNPHSKKDHSAGGKLGHGHPPPNDQRGSRTGAGNSKRRRGGHGGIKGGQADAGQGGRKRWFSELTCYGCDKKGHGLLKCQTTSTEVKEAIAKKTRPPRTR